jgi:hypothetical protein
LTEAVIHQIILGIVYEFEVQAVDDNGLESPWTSVMSHTVNPSPYDRSGSRLMMPQGEIYDGVESVFGWRWVSQPAGTTMEIVQDQVLRGAWSLKITVPAFISAQTFEIEQDPVDIIKGKSYEAWFGYYPSSGTWTTIQDRYQGYDKSGSALGADNVIRSISTGTNGLWDARSTGDNTPTTVNAGITNIRRRFAATVAAAGGVIYMTSPTWEEAIGTTRLHSDIETAVENKYRADGLRVLGTSYASGVVTLNGLTPDSSNDVIVKGVHSTLAANQSSPRLRTDDPSSYGQLNTSSLRTSNPSSPEDGDWWLINSSGVRTLRIRDGSTTVDLASSLLAAGSSFPGSPATGQHFFRTDRGIEYYYDGTRWLSTHRMDKYIPFATNSGGNQTTYTGTTLISRFHPPSNETYWVDRVTWWVRVDTTNNIFNYWTLRTGHEGNTFGGSVDLDIVTSGLTAGTAGTVVGTSFSGNPYDFSGTSYYDFFLEVRKDTGNPGTLNLWGVSLRMREVG